MPKLMMGLIAAAFALNVGSAFAYTENGGGCGGGSCGGGGCGGGDPKIVAGR